MRIIFKTNKKYKKRSVKKHYEVYANIIFKTIKTYDYLYEKKCV